MSSVAFSFSWEVSLMEWLQGAAGPVVTALAVAFTMLGEDMVLVAMLGFVYWCWDKQMGKYVSVNLAAGLVISPVIKNLVMRRRPYFDHPEIACLKPVDSDADLFDLAAQGYSFPSMHAADTMNFFGSIALRMKKALGWILAIGLALMTGLSRVLLGVHYPTDVLVGWVLGLVILYAMTKLQARLGSPVKAALVVMLVALPGWFFCRSDDFFSAYGILASLPLSFALEEKRIKFENTRKVLPAVLRVACGLLLFEVLNTVLKMPFRKELLESGTFAAYMIRAVRYFLAGFTILGVYPAAFRFRPFK